MLSNPPFNLESDYSLSVDEVSLLVVADYETILRVLGRYDPAEFLRILHQALRTPAIVSQYRRWIFTNERWDCSRLPHTLILKSGREVDCSGPTVTYVLFGETPDPSFERD